MADTRARQAMENAIATQPGDSVTVSKEVARDAIAPPDQSTSNWLYKMLVPGLLILTVISLVGLILLIMDANDATPPDLVLTTFTASLTGLLGLFIKSPTT